MLHHGNETHLVLRELGRAHERCFRTPLPPHGRNLFVFGGENDPVEGSGVLRRLHDEGQQRPSMYVRQVLARDRFRSTPRGNDTEYFQIDSLWKKFSAS